MADRKNGVAVDEFITRIDWDRLVRFIVQPLDEFLSDPQLVEEDPEMSKVFAVAGKYVSEQVEMEGWNALAHAITALQRKLLFDALAEGMRAVHGDISKARAFRRTGRGVVREATEESVRQWIVVQRGRPTARSTSEKAELRERLKKEIASRQAERITKGMPHAQADVLPDVAQVWGLSVGTLDHILRPRKTRPTSNGRKRRVATKPD